jgi:RNA polymerase sigma-70 factor (ECF subfamily)
MDINELVRRIKAGNQEAWTMIVNRYSKTVYNMALNFAGNSDDAADITQDIFLKVYNNIGKFDGENTFTAWLLRLSKNYCIDYWRKQKHHRQNVELDDNIRNEQSDKADTPEDSLIRQSEINYLRKKLLLLPPELRSLVIMRDIQDFSYQEIAENLDLPMGTIKSRINRARTKLAKIILNEGK